MIIINDQPRVFLGSEDLEPLSVRLRISLHIATEEIRKLENRTQTIADMVGDAKRIRHGIAMLGPEAEKNGIPVIPISAITDDHNIDHAKLRFVGEEIDKKHPHTKLKGGEVVISVKGTLGKTAIVPKELSGANITREVAVLPVINAIDAEFLLLVLNSRLGLSQITVRSFGDVVAESIVGSSITLPELRGLVIPKVTEKEKTTIVNRVKDIYQGQLSVKASIASLLRVKKQKALKKVDAYFAKELGIDQFVQTRNVKVFLRPEFLTERLDTPANHPDYTRLVDQMKEISTSGSLRDLVNVSEQRFNPDEHAGREVNYLAIGDIEGFSGKIIAPQTMLAEKLPSRARRLIHKGEILVGIAGASTGTENMVIYLVSQEEDGWVATTGFLVLRPKQSVDVDYVCRLLKAPFVLRQIRALLTSPAMPTISEGDLLNISVPVTNENTRKQVLEVIIRVISEERELISQLDTVSKQIDQLLAQAKSNIFDILDDSKYSAMYVKANELKEAMTKIEESLK